MDAENRRAVSLPMHSHDLVGDGSWLAGIRKAVPRRDREGNPLPPSNRPTELIGRQQRLLDYAAVMALKDHNVHHSTCLETKASSTVGLGHRLDRIAEVLDPLCRVSWAQVQKAAVIDAFEFGCGYIEVTRDASNNVTGLYHMPARHVWVFVEDNANDYHFEIEHIGSMRQTIKGEYGLRMARFGDRKRFLARRKISGVRKDEVSEIIEINFNLGRRSDYYGYPDWVAATPAMELDQCCTQYAFDLFLNGGIPEGIFSVTGHRMDNDDWKAIKEEFANHVGVRNRRKLMLLNLYGGENIKAELQKLTLDGQTTGDNQALVDDQALKVVSAHRVPPLMAGIQVPGKLGAANEMSNAMMSFQALVISPVQKHLSTLFACTLGHDLYGVEGLDAADFLGANTEDVEPDHTQPPDLETGMPAMKPKDHQGNGYRTITEEVDIGKLDAISKMRTSVSEAAARGRDVSQGTASRGNDISENRGDNTSR